MTPFVAAELVLAIVVLLVVGALTFVWARRRYISGDGRPVMLCARREGVRPAAGGSVWPGSAGPLEWFSIVGPSLRAEVSWLRGELDFGSAVPLSDPIPGLADPVAVQGRAGTQSCEFALVPAAYTAVRAWLGVRAARASTSTSPEFSRSPARPGSARGRRRAATARRPRAGWRTRASTNSRSDSRLR